MSSIREICRKSLLGLLYPVVRYCLRHSLKHRDVVEYLKLAFVKVAKEELESKQQPATPSKISLMTGIQRADISRLLEEVPTFKHDRDVVSRIVGLWQSGRRFRDKSGTPRILNFTGREGEFAELVSQVSTDLNPYTVAFELERTGIAEQTQAGLKLLKHGYEPAEDLEEAIGLLSEDSAQLHEAVLQNIFEPQPIKNLHVTTQFDNIPERFTENIRAWFLENGGEFHHKAREFLSSLDRDLNQEMKQKFPEDPPIRAAVGTVSLTGCVKTSKKS